jgi:hypothetical protein
MLLGFYSDKPDASVLPVGVETRMSIWSGPCPSGNSIELRPNGVLGSSLPEMAS